MSSLPKFKFKTLRPKKNRKPKLSRTSKPDEMSVEKWQLELRRQFGRDQKYQLKNLGDHPIFSEFQITNPASRNSYRILIRGMNPGDNFCSCPDFATNTLGTCKHLEFTLSRLEKRGGAKRAFQDGFQPGYSEVFLNYGAQREIRFRPGSDCPRELARLASQYFDETGVMRSESFQRFEYFLADCGSYDHDFRCREDALSFIAQVRDDERRRSAIHQMFSKGIRTAAFDKLIKTDLYDYQREGALFAALAGRSMIGDEMGLGKTVQALACAEILARTSGVERVLIVCPTSLKHQWEREIQKFTDRTVTVIGGGALERSARYRECSFFKITNYDTVHRDLEAIQELSPDLVILDEAQRIKNWQTRTAISVKRINSPYGLVLTGTPLENRLEELVSIVQFVDIHRFGPTFRFLNEHQVRDKFGRVVGYRNLDQISKTLEPVLIRRRKETVLDQLPERIENVFFVPMTPEQMNHHRANADAVASIVQRWRRLGFLKDSDQRRLMMCLQNMRMSCDSTYLLDESTKLGTKPDEIAQQLDDIFENSDAKVVIFSQWLKMHELLIERLKERKIGFAFFHGSVESSKRKGLIDQFRDDLSCRVFLATDAGSVGLNLQFANIVINADLPWNPAVLEQRIGRVHRLGQKKTVQVLNFVSQGTIEEGMLSVISFKKKVFAGVLDGGEKEVFLGGGRLKQFIETVERVTDNISNSTPEEPTPSEEPSNLKNGKAKKSAKDRKQETSQQDMSAGHAQDSSAVRLPISTNAGDSLQQLLQVGAQLFRTLLTGVASADSDRAGANGHSRESNARPLVQTIKDPETGETCLKLPMPKPEILAQAATALKLLLESVQPR